jgi:hypothetical protein
VRTLEDENQRKCQEVSTLQARGTQETERWQQSQQEALKLQRQVAEAEAAREGTQKEVGGLPVLLGRVSELWLAQGQPGLARSTGMPWKEH